MLRELASSLSPRLGQDLSVLDASAGSSREREERTKQVSTAWSQLASLLHCGDRLLHLLLSSHHPAPAAARSGTRR